MKVLFFAPHPDDVETFAGGTAIKHVDVGDEVIEVILSYGEKSSIDEDLKGESLAEIREVEGNKGAEIMGLDEVRFMGFEDIGISATDDKSQWWAFTSVGIDEDKYRQIRDTIEEIEPEIIYAPSCKRSPYRHKDHLATGKMILKACREINNSPTVRMYHGLHPNLVIDVSEYFDQVIEARKVHDSQEFMLRPLGQILQAYSWFLGLRKGCKYGEGFIEIKPSSSKT